MTSPERNKQVVRAYVERFNRGDLESLRELFAPDAVIFGVLGSGGVDFAMPIWRSLVEGLGTHLTIDSLSAESDTVAARLTERGTFKGPFRGHAPTGKPYEITAMEWFEFDRNGKIAKRWGARDSAAIARQVGMPIS